MTPVERNPASKAPAQPPEQAMDVLGMMKKSQESKGEVSSTTVAQPQDEVVYETKLDSKGYFAPKHDAKVKKLADTSQRYPYLMECSCGFQARSYTEDNAKQAADGHIAANTPA